MRKEVSESLHQPSSDAPRLSPDGVAAGKLRPSNLDLWFQLGPSWARGGKRCKVSKRFEGCKTCQLRLCWKHRALNTDSGMDNQMLSDLDLGEVAGNVPLDCSKFCCEFCCLGTSLRLVPTLVCNVTLLEGALKGRKTQQHQQQRNTKWHNFLCQSTCRAMMNTVAVHTVRLLHGG